MNQKQAVAVIDIGTSAIRMVVAEVGPKSQIRYLENLLKSVRFGKDVFTTGRLSNSSMREGVRILKNFKTVLDGYGVTTIETIATSALREAANSDNFIDQVFVRTGIDIEIIEGPEENRLELIAVEHSLQSEVDLRQKNCLIVEVGSGSTEMITLNQGKVETTRTIALGSSRLPEKASVGKTDPLVMQRLLKRTIQEVAAHAAKEHSLKPLDTFIALGGDMRFAVNRLVEKPDERFEIIDKKKFQNFVNKVARLSPDEIVSTFGINYTQAESVYPALLVYAYFLAETSAEQVIVPMLSIRDGLLIEMAQLFSGKKRTDVSKQVLNSAKHLAERYSYDRLHSQNVASLALKLYDSLQNDHGMGAKERMLLEISAILHDIGSFISPTSHHKHSSYLVNASDIFGLRKADKNIVANVVRYHRRALPRPSHVSYMSLPKNHRAVVSKLAAILRIADALDSTHQQKIRELELESGSESYAIWVSKECGDLSFERAALRDKGDMFAEVFGAPISIKQRKIGT